MYMYPYNNLPRLISHIHPKFVIFNAGEKLTSSNLSIDQARTLVDDNPGIGKMLNLYSAWIRPPPKGYESNESYEDPKVVLVPVEDSIDSSVDDPEDPEDTDYKCRTYRTKSGRGDGFRPHTRSVAVVAAAEQAAANRDGNGVGDGRTRTRKAPVKKRKVLSESFTQNRQLLSEATLSRINQQTEEAAWSAERIRQWSSFAKKRRVVPSHPF
jgi:hypothetical protein